MGATCLLRSAAQVRQQIGRSGVFSHMTRRNLVIGAFGFALPGSQTTPFQNDAWGEADYLLKRGRRFERARLLLEGETRARPGDSRSWAALGCAHAGRAASLAYAAKYALALETERASFAQRLKEWEQAQTDSDAPLYKTSKPKLYPPRVFLIPDDSEPFRMSEQATKQVIATLAQQAREAWARAEAGAKTSGEKAEFALLQGWGLRLLRRFATLYGPNGGKGVPVFVEPDGKEITAAFERAVAADAQNPLCFRALGDWHYEEKGTVEKAEEAYRNALRLDPRQPALWYRLYVLSNRQQPTDDNLRERLERLAQVVRYDKSNAFPRYEEASVRLRPTMLSLLWLKRMPGAGSAASDKEVAANVTSEQTRKAARLAVAAVRRGNESSACFVPVYREAVPRYLAVPWNYGYIETSYEYGSRFRELARALGGCALAFADVGDTNGAADAARALIEFGEKNGARDARADPSNIGDGSVTGRAIGFAAVTVGYQTLAQVYDQAGQTELAKTARADGETAKKQQQTFNEAITRLLANDDPYTYYRPGSPNP